MIFSAIDGRLARIADIVKAMQARLVLGLLGTMGTLIFGIASHGCGIGTQRNRAQPSEVESEVEQRSAREEFAPARARDCERLDSVIAHMNRRIDRTSQDPTSIAKNADACNEGLESAESMMSDAEVIKIVHLYNNYLVGIAELHENLRRDLDETDIRIYEIQLAKLNDKLDIANHKFKVYCVDGT